MRQRQGLIFFAILAFFAIIIPYASATSITYHRVISKWTIGAPWEPIKFGVNITDSSVDILNVTLFCSLNTTDIESYTKIQMELAEGNLRNGFWSYTLPGQPNSTDVYYAYAVYFVDGSYDGPIPQLDYPYVWRVRSPQRGFRLNYIGIKNVDPFELTVDLDCNFIIIWDSDLESVTVRVYNRISEHYLSELRFVNVPQKGNRYEYIDTVHLDDLELSGDPSSFPFDAYFLDLEFELLGTDKSEMGVQDFRLWEPFSYTWDFSYDKPTITDQKINIKFYFERRIQNALNTLLPLGICLFVLGATPMISSYKHLRARLAIYIALFVFLLNFTGYIKNYVPLKALGVSFAETAFLILSLFVGIYLISSVIGNYLGSCLDEGKTEDKTRRFLTKEMVGASTDFVAVLLSIGVALFLVVVKSNSTSKTLFDLMPEIRFQIIFLIALCYGLILEISIAVFRQLRDKEES